MESGELLPQPEPPVGSNPGRRGGWRAAFFLIAVVFFERIGFIGFEGNLIMYLTGPLGMSTAAAAAAVNAWAGTVLVLPLVGALAADSRLGRYGAVITASVLGAKVLGAIGLEEFFYDQAPAALRSVGVSLLLSALGVGSYASGAIVSAIDWATTRGGGESWFEDNLNRAHLDYYYWLLSGLAALDVAVFFYFANRYVYRNKG
ncbi:unnamed protein product [Urochloa decumbens]|uniref:Uncharacterized protein n=1 Tax=Urochloa decumbens TaxID=240449 RepID=A0ABC9GVN2_9POAL